MVLSPERSTQAQSGAEAATVALWRRAAAAGLQLPLRLWSGQTLGPDTSYRIVLRQPWSLRAMLLPPTDLAAGEAYVRGDIGVEGDMVEALRAIATAARALGPRDRADLLAHLLRLPRPPAGALPRRAHLHGRRHSRERDRAAVQFHYDVGNDFFATFLDRNLVYSCAYFTDDDGDLDRAQARKLDLICRKLRLQPGETFLDIGCGWGSLLIHAARHYGVEAVGVTLSRGQAKLARERIAAAGLDGRATIRLADYREIRGRFDAIASVGMFEHVGVEQLGHYFRTVHALTADGGRFLNHGITTGRRTFARDLARDRRSFVAAHVFPDGGLVPLATAVDHMERAGFEVYDVEQLRPHYARTLRHWLRRLEAGEARAVAAASVQDYRVWRAYMAGSVIGFEGGDLGVAQILGGRGATLPLGRSWMTPSA